MPFLLSSSLDSPAAGIWAEAQGRWMNPDVLPRMEGRRHPRLPRLAGIGGGGLAVGEGT